MQVRTRRSSSRAGPQAADSSFCRPLTRSSTRRARRTTCPAATCRARSCSVDPTAPPPVSVPSTRRITPRGTARSPASRSSRLGPLRTAVACSRPPSVTPTPSSSLRTRSCTASRSPSPRRSSTRTSSSRSARQRSSARARTRPSLPTPARSASPSRRLRFSRRRRVSSARSSTCARSVLSTLRPSLHPSRRPTGARAPGLRRTAQR